MPSPSGTSTASLAATAARAKARAPCGKTRFWTTSSAPTSPTSGSQIDSRVWRFTVSVPVLSDAITVQEPSPSTAAIRRTITERLAMREAATESTTVSATGSPSGMAETASATATKKTSESGVPRQSSIPASTTAAPTTAMLIVRANRSIRSISGGRVPSPRETAAAIAPNSVSPPVATVTPVARPDVTTVPAWAMESRSATGASAATGCVDFSTGSDSPVRADSSTARSSTSTSRRSAGTRFPDSSSTRSPGTTSSDGTERSRPPRTTRTSVSSRWRRASAALSAFHSWKVPTTALTSTTTRMKAASRQSPSPAETAAATRRT